MIDEPITVDKIKVRPSHLAQICPVCNGWTTVKHGTLSCNACKDESGRSKGYILIPAEKERETDYGERIQR